MKETMCFLMRLTVKGHLGKGTFNKTYLSWVRFMIEQQDDRAQKQMKGDYFIWHILKGRGHGLGREGTGGHSGQKGRGVQWGGIRGIKGSGHEGGGRKGGRVVKYDVSKTTPY